MSEDERQIRSVIQSWMDASRRNDVAAVLELMTDDVLFLTPGKPPFGKEEFAKAMESMKGITFDGQNDVQEIIVEDNWAFVRGELKIHARLPDGKEMSRAGSVLSIFRRGPDGKWRIARDANLLG